MIETTNQYIYIYYPKPSDVPYITPLFGPYLEGLGSLLQQKLTNGSLSVACTCPFPLAFWAAKTAKNSVTWAVKSVHFRCRQPGCSWVHLMILCFYGAIHSVTDLLLAFWAVTVGVSKHG